MSDLHLGHPSIDADTMIERYSDLIFPKLKETDILLINGDLFDSALSLADSHTPDILIFLANLIDLCKKEKVVILTVRGTFSHDRDQIKVFYNLSQNKKMGNNSRYYDKISLDEVCGKKFLFLPDDLPFKNSDEILDQVHKMLTEKKWDNVDYALAHGYFDFMVPAGVHQPKITYRPEQFHFVKKLVNVGHVHTTRCVDNKGIPILYNGSPERLRHGEEEDKGIYLVKEKSDNITITFIENKESTVFKEIKNSKLTEKTALTYWKKIFDKLPRERLAYYKFTHPDIGVRLAIDNLSKSYPHVMFTHRSPKDKEKLHVSKDDLSISITKTHIPTKETFSKDILSFLRNCDRGKSLTEESINRYLEEV